ncbi:MAG TPA: hypothetical protein VJY15_24030, partial [Candidatus Acidoferrum sp.]|nr:hypothetical protein [Candidatus Acidoferrum sp.]
AVAEPAVDSVVPPPPASVSVTGSASPVARVDMKDARDDKGQVAKQSLVDNFHASERGSRASGILPVRVNLPAFGPSLYLVSELTSENQSPSAEFNYQQEKKAGGK